MLLRDVAVYAEVMTAEQEADFLEAIDAGYERMVLLRDFCVAQLEPSSKKKAAAELWKQLVINQVQIKDSFKQLRELHYKKATEEWIQTEAPKHDVFLDKVMN
jgi:hypothetical protein